MTNAGSEDFSFMLFGLLILLPIALFFLTWQDLAQRKRAHKKNERERQPSEKWRKMIQELKEAEGKEPDWSPYLEAVAKDERVVRDKSTKSDKDYEDEEEEPIGEDEIENIVGKSFEQMTPDEFEDAVCKLFNAFGYNLSVTQRSKDGGIDLDGLRGGLGRARIVVQCKRYSSPVGVSAVRELFGVVSDDPEIAEGFLVTTSTFTQDAQAFARGKRITLMDGSDLEMRFSELTGSTG